MDSVATTPSQKTQLLLALGELTHQLQLERGCTALFVDSKGEIFSDELRAQYGATDAALQALDEFATEGTSLWDRKFQDIRNNDPVLRQHRDQIQQSKLSFAKAINTYTYAFLAPILDINVELALQIKDVDPIKVSAYSNFLQWKERAGRERAWGTHGFCSKVFRNREFSERMITLIEEQSAYKKAFLSLATPGQSQMIEAALGGYVMELLENIHAQLAVDDQSDDLEALSPVTWFELLTGKIDRLKLAEDALVKALAPTDIAVRSTTPAKRHSMIEPHMPIIRALPAFSKLEESELDTLLSHADLRTYDKGKLLFLQGEPLSRFYLILKGWVKLFKGSGSGDEAVLQMLSAGDSLMEAAVFLNIPSTVSAQVVQDAVLLSLPAPIVRQSLMDNRKFALNMINNLSMRSHGLIRQIEHSRLKTASERVGWFLLQLGIEQSGGKSSTITLPYDKSTMASYLDMTPETFSRTLKQFRNKGFRIHNDKITQPDPDALCKFCDETLAETCVFKDKPSCPQTYLL